jgi:HEAT repeat protein
MGVRGRAWSRSATRPSQRGGAFDRQRDASRAPWPRISRISPSVTIRDVNRETAITKARSLEAKLARLRQLRSEPLSPELSQELQSALCDRSSFVVAEAAEAIGHFALADLAPDLAAAFERFLIDPIKTDKLCRAKIAIAQTLDKLEYLRPDIFLQGIRHVQPEPVWGGEQDSAAPLRGACAFALVRIGHPGVLNLLVDLLTDPEKDARLAAVQAVAYSGTQAVASCSASRPVWAIRSRKSLPNA